MAGVADVVGEHEVRAIGDRRQQPAEDVLGDVVAMRVPQDQHAGRIAHDRLEVGRGDVLFARIEVRQARTAAPAGHRARVSVRQRIGQAQADDAGVEGLCGGREDAGRVAAAPPSSTISVGAKSSAAAKSWPHWNDEQVAGAG